MDFGVAYGRVLAPGASRHVSASAIGWPWLHPQGATTATIEGRTGENGIELVEGVGLGPKAYKGHNGFGLQGY